MLVTERFRWNPRNDVTTIDVTEILYILQCIHKVRVSHEGRSKSIEGARSLDAGQQRGQRCAKAMAGKEHTARDGLKRLLKSDQLSQRCLETAMHVASVVPMDWHRIDIVGHIGGVACIRSRPLRRRAATRPSSASSNRC